MSEKHLASIKRALNIAVNVGCGFEGDAEDAAELLNLIETNESRIAELEAERRWIPVSEPPKVSGKYLLLNIYDDVYPCDFIAETEMWVLPDYDTITHWMPLPELPIVYGKVCEE